MKQVTKILNIAYKDEIAAIEGPILAERETTQESVMDDQRELARETFFRKKYAQFMSKIIKQEHQQNLKIAKAHGAKAVTKMSSRVKYFQDNKDVVYKMFTYVPTKASVTNAKKKSKKTISRTDKTYISTAFIANMAKYMSKKTTLKDQIRDPKQWTSATLRKYHAASY